MAFLNQLRQLTFDIEKGKGKRIIVATINDRYAYFEPKNFHNNFYTLIEKVY